MQKTGMLKNSGTQGKGQFTNCPFGVAENKTGDHMGVAPTALRSDFDEFNFFRFTFFLYKIIFFCQYFMYKEKMRVME